MRKKLISRMTMTTLVVLAGLLATHAQSNEPFPNQPAAAGQQEKHQESLTGCLQKGTGDSYILTMENGQRIAVTGSPDLSKHVDHTVKLTGTSSGKGAEAVFQASKVELVAESCNR